MLAPALGYLIQQVGIKNWDREFVSLVGDYGAVVGYALEGDDRVRGDGYSLAAGAVEIQGIEGDGVAVGILGAQEDAALGGIVIEDLELLALRRVP